MSKFRITTTRKNAALYFAAEFGIKRANEILKAHTTPELIELPMFRSKPTKTNAKHYAHRASLMIARQEGRLGKPRNAEVFVERV